MHKEVAIFSSFDDDGRELFVLEFDTWGMTPDAIKRTILSVLKPYQVETERVATGRILVKIISPPETVKVEEDDRVRAECPVIRYHVVQENGEIHVFKEGDKEVNPTISAMVVKALEEMSCGSV